MIGCRKARGLIAKSLYEHLGGRDLESLERHLAKCEVCRRDAEALAKFAASGEIPKPTVPIPADRRQAKVLGRLAASSEIVEPTVRVPAERIEQSILVIRGQNVLLDSDLAKLYGVETGQLTRAVRRNIDRFPEDFMFQLSDREFRDLRCQFGTSRSWGGRRYPPRVFTEQGVSMLSSVLRSRRAIQVNVQIMRTFVRLRKMLSSHEELARKLKALEGKYDKQFKVVFDAIRQLTRPPESRRRQIGFHPPKKERKHRE